MAKKKTALETLEEAVEDAVNAKLPEPNLSMGNALFNLALSDNVSVGAGPGRYIHFAGSSSSGKSWLTIAMLAEAARNPAYDNHKLVFIDNELGVGFSVEQYFGKKAASRIESIRVTSLERFYDRMTALMKDGPIVAVLDSFDALTDEAALKKIEDDTKARDADKDPAGSYAMSHARVHSARLREMVRELGMSGSIFTGISQERSNVNGGMFEPKSIISGGRALKYWASIQVVTSLAGKIEKEIKGKKRIVGHKVRLRIEKNRISGKTRDVLLTFIPGFGFDEIGSNVDWLVEEKFLPSSSGRITCPWYEKAYYREELVKRIEDDNRESDLLDLLQNSWTEIESLTTIERKPRYE